MKLSLNKKDRLKSYSKIRELFNNGMKFRHHPIGLFYQIEEGKFEDGVSMKMGVTVGSKHFKKAVQRNLLKRRIRESYRLQRTELWKYLSNSPLKLSLFFVYTEQTEVGYDKISSSMKILLDKCLEVAIQKVESTKEKK
jgi:ribonuclease P protein component